MSASNEWTEWHLTQSGWVRGTTKSETEMSISATPFGSVLVFQYIEEHSGYGKGTMRAIQTSPLGTITDAANRLLLLHGQCPQTL